MNARFFALILVFCGLAATSAEAKPRTVPDRITAVAADGGFTLQQHGNALLAGIEILNPAAVTTALGRLETVEVKSLGRDRYDRARVLLFAPGAKTSLQEALLAQGAAAIFGMEAATKAWQKAEAQAIGARRGIWGDATRHATPADVAGHEGQWTLVTGTVHKVAVTRATTYINFGEDWRQDFTASVPRRYQRAFRDTLAGLEGKRVRVRGMVMQQNGPMIALTRPEQLEILDAKSQ